MIERAEATVRIRLASPFAFQGLAPSAFGIDVSLLRDGEGRVIMPGTLLRGNLRAALEAIATRCPDLVTEQEIAVWFGRPSPKGTDDEPARSLMQVDDLEAITGEPAEGGSYHRIAIDDARGSVRHGALQIIELPWPIGTEVTFEGRIVVFMEAAVRAKLHRALEVALSALPALGAFKSAGFGRVLGAELNPLGNVRPLALTLATGTGLGDAVEVVLELDRPFLVDAERVADNVFRGSEVIPGAVIKGAIARRALLAASNDAAFHPALATIVVGHAFPIARSTDPTLSLRQPCPLPLSLVSVPPREGSGGPHRLADVLLADEPCLFDGRAPLFQRWKARARPDPDPRQLCDWPDSAPLHDTRVRTEIDGASWAASEQQLFAHAAVRPEAHFWLLRIARNGADERIFAQVLGAIQEGIDGIGRTKAHAFCRHVQKAGPADARPLGDGAATPRFAVTLQTEALLNDVEALRDGDALEDDYVNYWQHASSGRLSMVRFFARQRLAGGHIATRHRLDPACYDPFLLTEAGSVFLLAGDGGAMIEGWCRHGLPLPRSLEGRACWRTCSYLRENGYGAVRINAVDHVRLKKGADAV